MVQRGHTFAIVDEVDSILVDEARTPLIISGPSDDKSDLYIAIDKIIPLLVPGDFDLDEKQRNVSLTERATSAWKSCCASTAFSPKARSTKPPTSRWSTTSTRRLRAHKLFPRDKDYIVRNDEVVIIDEFTGRMMPGRRYSEGLHQALEAKENVQVQPENVTLASITFQNYFRLYGKLAGMTGTAATEANEFAEIYKLDVVEIPTNMPMIRIDEDDEVYRTDEEKLKAIIAEIEDANAKAQPLLVGTTSIEKSEQLARIPARRTATSRSISATPGALDKLYASARVGQAVEELRGPQRPLPRAGSLYRRGGRRARRHHHRHQHGGPRHRHPARRQRSTCACARNARAWKARPAPARSRPSARKSRISRRRRWLAGGLYIIGTERHESRRIDNQLRGRSGRQGDPGRSKFFLSLQDDLMRIFGSDRMDSMLVKLGLKEGEAIIHPWINKALEKAQQKVEARNFDMRKNMLKFDNVMNDQRKVVFEQRRDMMAQEIDRATSSAKCAMAWSTISSAPMCRMTPIRKPGTSTGSTRR